MEQAARKRRKRKKQILPFLLFAAVILIISLCLGIAFRYKPTTERYNTKRYFKIENDTQAALIVDSVLLEEHALLQEGSVYLTYEQVTSYITSRFYWEESTGQMLYTLPDQVAAHGQGDGILVQDGQVYISLDLVRQYTGISSGVFDSPARVVIESAPRTYETVQVKGARAVRYRGGVKSPILKDVEDGETLILLEEGDNWSNVQTMDGYIGYIEKKYLKEKKEASNDVAPSDQGYAGLTRDHPVNLVWHQVTNQSQNGDLSGLLAQTKGLNVISPTWFYLSDEAGGIHSLASSDYVAEAHQAGLEVWGLVDDFTQEVNIEAILKNPAARQQLIDNLLYAAAECGMDGINVDFEKLNKEAGAAFIQFIRELSLRCHSNGFVLSVDNVVPYEFNSFYNRKEQGVFADYVIVMSYDEHLNESTGEGSVASIDYVTTALDRMLAEVPKEKLINAIPFYTRVWKEVPKTEEQIAAEGQNNSEEEYLPYTLSWETLGMKSMEEALVQRGVQLNWDETCGQYYGEYLLEDGTKCKVWVEEERSIEEKLKVMQERQIAGVAAWKLGLEKSIIWDVIAGYYSGQ